MQISVTGRHFTVDDALRKTVEEKLMSVLDNKSLKISSASVVMDREGGHRFRVDVSVRYKQHNAEAKAEDYELYKALDTALIKVDTQLARFLDRVQDHHATPLRDVVATEEPAE